MPYVVRFEDVHTGELMPADVQMSSKLTAVVNGYEITFVNNDVLNSRLADILSKFPSEFLRILSSNGKNYGSTRHLVSDFAGACVNQDHASCYANARYRVLAYLGCSDKHQICNGALNAESNVEQNAELNAEPNVETEIVSDKVVVEPTPGSDADTPSIVEPTSGGENDNGKKEEVSQPPQSSQLQLKTLNDVIRFLFEYEGIHIRCSDDLDYLTRMNKEELYIFPSLAAGVVPLDGSCNRDKLGHVVITDAQRLLVLSGQLSTVCSATLGKCIAYAEQGMLGRTAFNNLTAELVSKLMNYRLDISKSSGKTLYMDNEGYDGLVPPVTQDEVKSEDNSNDATPGSDVTKSEPETEVVSEDQKRDYCGDQGEGMEDPAMPSNMKIYSNMLPRMLSFANKLKSLADSNGASSPIPQIPTYYPQHGQPEQIPQLSQVPQQFVRYDEQMYSPLFNHSRVGGPFGELVPGSVEYNCAKYGITLDDAGLAKAFSLVANHQPLPLLRCVDIDDMTKQRLRQLLLLFDQHNPDELVKTKLFIELEQHTWFHGTLALMNPTFTRRMLDACLPREFLDVRERITKYHRNWVFNENKLGRFYDEGRVHRMMAVLRMMVGPALETLDLSHTFITGSAICAALTLSSRKSAKDVEEMLQFRYPAYEYALESSDHRYSLMEQLKDLKRPESMYSISYDEKSSSIVVKLKNASNERPSVSVYPVTIKSSTDIDMLYHGPKEKFEETAYKHLRTFQRAHPFNQLTLKKHVINEEKGYYRYTILDENDPNFRNVEIYQADPFNVFTHHVGAVRGYYGCNFLNENRPDKGLYIAASALITAEEHETPNYYYFASKKKSPLDIARRYRFRGISVPKKVKILMSEIFGISYGAIDSSPIQGMPLSPATFKYPDYISPY